MYRLTPEARLYLKEGFPEENLVKILKFPQTIEEVKRIVPNFNIAIQWAKKKGWIKIENNKLILVKRPGSSPELEALKQIEAGGSPSSEMLAILLSRRLIEKEKVTLKKTRKLIGKEITRLTPELIKTSLWKKVKFKPYNVSARGEIAHPGKHHPYNQFLRAARQRLVEMGFQEMTGPLIELEFWNFDALYQPQNHPSRDWTQTYTLKYPKQGKLPAENFVKYVKATHESGWKTGSTGWGYKWNPNKAARLMPRAHDTAISPRYLSGYSGKIEIPGKYFSLVRCFRPDVIDATHGVEFNQLGGFIIDEGLNFRQLLGLLKEFTEQITGLDQVRFRPDYFPFTEPSCEVSAKHPEMGWMELAGAGVFRPELTKPLGINLPVIAWGFGIDRLAMLKLGIKDIRNLFTSDLKWLRDKTVI